MNIQQVKALLQEREQAADIAELFDELDPKTTLLAFRLLPKELAVDVFAFLTPETQVNMSQLVSEDELQEIIDELFFDDMIDFLEEMPANVVKKILLNAPETKRSLINQFLNYPQDSAGSIMTIEFVDLRKEMTVREALDKIRHIALEKETIYTCYVMNNKRHLEGIVTLRDLVISEPEKKITEIMESDFVSVSTFEDTEEVAAIIQKYNLLAIPVTDHENRLVGIITVDDIMDVVEEAFTEDVHKMATIGDVKTSLLNAKPIMLLKGRLPWLLILVFINMLSGAGMAYFEETIQAIVALVFFLPMLIDGGGNTGAQTSALVIRALAVGEIELRDAPALIRKELKVSLSLGVVMGLVIFVVSFLAFGFDVALVVSLSMLIVIILGSFVGMLLPFFLERFDLDPATASGPLVTSIMDIFGVLIYFSIATSYFGL